MPAGKFLPIGRWSISSIRPISIGVAPPLCAKIQRMLRNRVVVPEVMRLRMVRVVSNGNSSVCIASPGTVFVLFEHRREGRIAQPFPLVIGKEADAVRLQRAEGVIDLAQAALGVGQRDRREKSEARRV